MRLSDLCIRRPVFTTMLIASLVVLGLASYRDLGLDAFPRIEFPTITVTTTLEGATPEEVESQITKPIEEVVNTINGIDELRSTTKEGISQVFVAFVLEKPVEVAANEVRDKVATILAQFPPGTDPPIIEKLDPDATPILALVVSGRRSDREITEIADKQIKRQIETVNGVGSLTFVGDRKREIQLELDADKLAAYGLAVEQVKQAVQQQNTEIPGGRITKGQREEGLRTQGRIEQVEDFSRLIVADVKGAPVRIADIGRAVDGTEEPRTLSRLNGENAVSLLVRKQSGTNTVQVVDRVRQRVAEIQQTLPPDIRVLEVRDLSRFIRRSMKEVQEHLILGGILASIVVYFFIWNLRAAFIAALAIPTSIIGTFTLLKYAGFTLNNQTMLGLSLSVGIVIDDAIVVLENIFRYIEEKDYAPAEAAIAATKEIAMAVMATTLSLVVIFVPIAFLSGISGKFLHSFGITMSFAIMVSMFVSFTLTPMMCSVFIKPMAKRVAAQDLAGHQARLSGGHRISKQTGFYSLIDRHYTRMLEWSMAHRAALVCIAGLIFISMFPVYQKIGKEYIPRDDQDEFSIGVKTPEGTSIEGTNAVLKNIEARVWKLRGVQHVLASINSSRRASVTDADIYVRLVPLSERTFNWLNPVHLYRYLTADHPEQKFYTQFEVMADARRMLRAFPGIRTGVATISGLGTGGRGGGEIEFNIRGPDLAQLSVISNQIMAEMKKAPGLTDVDSTINLGYPELRVRVDRDKAADLGVRVGDVASALRTMISGEERLTRFKDLDDQYEVRLRVHASNRRNADSIAQLMIPSSRLGQVHLENVATLYRDLGPAEINRYNRARQISVSCNLETWKPMGEAVADVKNVIESVGLPAGYDYRVAGRARRLEETMRDFAKAFLLSLVFMYMILASQFDSFIHPITIMSAIPMSIPFALLSLMATGRTLNMRSALGILLLFGIVKKNGILQVDFTNVLRRKGTPRYQAIIEANRTRLRPILMTTISIIAGLIPAALSKGPGSAQNTAIAISVIGGQTFCLLLTLLLTPVLYSLFDDLGQLVRRRSPEKAPAAAPGD